MCAVGLCRGRPKLPVELLWRPVEFMQDFRPLVVLRKELPQAGFVCLLDRASTLLIHALTTHLCISYFTFGLLSY